MLQSDFTSCLPPQKQSDGGLLSGLWDPEGENFSRCFGQDDEGFSARQDVAHIEICKPSTVEKQPRDLEQHFVVLDKRGGPGSPGCQGRNSKNYHHALLMANDSTFSGR